MYPYDYPEQWQAGFPAGWDPQAVLLQALQMQQGGLPVMPQAQRGGISGQAASSQASYTPATMQAPTQQGGGQAAPAPAYYGPMHQALSQNLSSSLSNQSQLPGLLSEKMQHGNWPTWQAEGGLFNNLYSPSFGYSRVDWLPNDPNANAQAQMLAQAQANNVRWGTPIPAGLQAQVTAAQQAPAPAPQTTAPAMTPEMQAQLLAQMQQSQQQPYAWTDVNGGM